MAYNLVYLLQLWAWGAHNSSGYQLNHLIVPIITPIKHNYIIMAHCKPQLTSG